VLNFRSCARDERDIERRLPNRRPRLYHSGETGDLEFLVRTLIAREPETPLYALGFSLGGAVLLKWLGEAGPASAIRAAAVISVPYDLAVASRFLERPVGRFYTSFFAKRLKSKSLDLLVRFPRETAHVDPERVRRARTFAEFDDCLTAPLHGFAGVDDYYRRSSALPLLARIAVPTLCLSSEDDPLIPGETAHQARAAAPANVTVEITKWGGHNGFVSGSWPWRPSYWAEERAMEWLLQAAARSA
jgi:hypothetical protein